MYYQNMKMRKILLHVCLCLLTAAAVSAQTVREPKSEGPAARLESELPVLMERADLPGLSVALIRGRKLVWTKGFGVGHAEKKGPVTPGTVFEAASLSKPVFAYAVLKLADAGKLDLDRPLMEILGGNYDVGDDERLKLITARRVLSHTSGFPNWRRPIDSDTLPIIFTPGERFGYSGEGYVYLAKVVEKITGKRFEEFVKETVLGPLGMNDSSFVWEDRYADLHVFGHDKLGGVAERKERREGNAAASLHTTAPDYARFVIALLEGKGLKKETRREMLRSQIVLEKAPELSWGLGIGLVNGDAKGPRAVWHWGDNGNSKAFVIASPKTGDGILFFANGANGLSFAEEVLEAAGLAAEGAPALGWLDYERYDSPARLLLREIAGKGAEKALLEYRESREKEAARAVDERGMNRLGYDLMFMDRLDAAILVFEQNTKDFPASANVWDSLAEAYMKKGEKELAIRYYERSLELDPENENAVRQLGKLRSN